MDSRALAISPERKQSNKLLRQWCGGIRGDVLSIGAAGDLDKEGSRYRDYFGMADRYVTSDIEPVMDCDLVLDVRKMTEVWGDSYDAVFVSGVLEHVDDCHAAVREIYRVLKSGGTLIVGVPFKQPVHRAPQDFWRFTEYGLRYLLREFSISEVRAIGDDFPFAYWAKAVKP